jgi:DNA-binding beta-propeller fold protein YncE
MRSLGWDRTFLIGAVVACLLGGCKGGGGGGGDALSPPPPKPPFQPPPAEANPIPAENAKAGDPSWVTQGGQGHAVELYLDRVSAKAGDSVAVMASADPSSSAHWFLYRLGWYGGVGARRVLEGPTVLTPQGACPVEPTRGYLRCSWKETFSFSVPRDAVSGLYLVKIARADGRAATAPLVVTDDRPASLLFQSSVTTAQAYNTWGGESLYQDGGGTVPGGMATAVSFERPYKSDGGSGQVLRYEARFGRFLERNGYDVTYTTNLDVARQGTAALLPRGAFLSIGHDEYWPPEERDAVERARDQGLHALFFGANAAYWKVRLEDPGPDGNAHTVVCYKMNPASDPSQDATRTGRFRDPPENRPENELVGVMYQSYMLVAHTWTVADPAHFLYAGTGFSRGDTIPGIVGYEFDATLGAKPPGTPQLVSRSTVVDAEGVPATFEAVSYRTPGGALVFGAGTIYWSLGLDGPLRDARLERMTANVFHEALQLPVPDALQAPRAPDAPPQLGTPAASSQALAQGFLGPSSVAVLPGGALAVTDAVDQRVLRIAPAPSYAVSVIAGDGNVSSNPAYDNVPGARARFYRPTGIAADAAGNLYVADTHNDCIRKIANDAEHTTTTFAGAFHSGGFADGIGHAARFSAPMGIAYDAANDRLLVADDGNARVRAIQVATAGVTTLAGGGDATEGPGTSVRLRSPTAVAVAGDGRVFVVCSGDSTLWAIGADPAHTALALVRGGPGFADGPGTTARLMPQVGLAWGQGALYVSDPGNSRIRLVIPGSDAASTSVSTFAGTGRADGAPAALGLPLGLATIPGSLLVVDASSSSVRAIPR